MSKIANYLHMMKSPMVTDLLEENRCLKAKIDTLHEVIQMCLSNPRPAARVSTRKPLRKPPTVAIKIEPGLEVVSDIEMDVSQDGDSDGEDVMDVQSDDDSDIMVVDPPQKKENIVYQLEEVPTDVEVQTVQASEAEAQASAQAGEEEEASDEEEVQSAPVDKAAQPADAPADEEEEVYEVTIKGKIYYVVNEQNGPIYAADADGDVGDQVGKYVNGVATF